MARNSRYRPVRLPVELDDRVAQEAERFGITRSMMIRVMLRFWFASKAGEKVEATP